MGGMAVLEWPLCSPPGYIRHIVPLATSARHSAWCISWGETQRQCIYSDPAYEDGYYVVQPSSGLTAARMAALLTYRSRDSFETRFGRRPQVAHVPSVPNGGSCMKPSSPLALSEADKALIAHNEGHQRATRPISQAQSPNGQHSPTFKSTPSPPPVFSAQSYLRYQGAKFVARFDANCYIHITRKMDTHDIARGRSVPSSSSDTHATTTATITDPTSPHTDPHASEAQSAALAAVLATLPPRTLIISIETDGLFTPSEQRDLAAYIPGAELVVIPSPDGHDGFLLEFERINGHVLAFLKRELPEYYQGEGESMGEGDFAIKKTSLFGEAEADVTRW